MKLFSFFLLIFLSVATGLQAQHTPEKADALLSRYLELKRFNGAALVANQQEVLFNKGYGMANYELGVPIGEQTSFNIAGITEQLTAYTVLRVVDEKGLSLQAPIKDYLVDLKLSHADKITLHQLLAHTSGLPDYPLMYELPEKQFFSKNDLVNYLESIVLEGEPGQVQSYSKLNYNLLGLIVEHITKEPFAAALAKYVTAPIGMKNISLDSFTALVKHRAKGYSYSNYDAGWENATYLHPSNTFAAQGILSTAEDLLLWNRFVIDKHQNDKALQKMLTSNQEGFGYGVQLSRSEAGNITEIKSIAAYNSGFNAFSSISLDNKLVVIVLGNNRNPASGDISTGLQAIFSNQEYKLPLPRKVVKVDRPMLQKLAGVYKINDQVSIQILVEGNRVFVDDGMRPKFEIFPQSESQFFIEGVDAELLFIKDDNGAVTQIGLKNDGFLNGYAKKVVK